MINEFSRTEMLIGQEGLMSLKNAAVAVFGVGGVGSHAIEALARCGVGRLVLIDNDTVSLTNINRQSIAFHSTIGCHKTQVMKEKIRDICPDTQVITFEEFVLPDNIDLLFENIMDRMDPPGPISYILDAIDTVTAKLALAEYAARHGIPLISSMGTGNKLHPEQFRISDISKTSVCPLCKVMRRELKKRGVEDLKVVYSQETPLGTGTEKPHEQARKVTPASAAFVPSAAGLIIAGEVVKDLTGKRGAFG